VVVEATSDAVRDPSDFVESVLEEFVTYYRKISDLPDLIASPTAND
jgi:hypothetical protein